jgi:hypothetical protein
MPRERLNCWDFLEFIFGAPIADCSIVSTPFTAANAAFNQAGQK